eukprot:2079755-Pyramimonas_sp.AAC.1
MPKETERSWNIREEGQRKTRTGLYRAHRPLKQCVGGCAQPYPRVGGCASGAPTSRSALGASLERPRDAGPRRGLAGKDPPWPTWLRPGPRP